MNLSGKKILVAGASSGIGQATALMVSQLGGKVILNGRDSDRLNYTLSKLDGDGHYAMPYDLTNLDGLKQYVDECIQVDQCRFDGLVFCAGTTRGALLRRERYENYTALLKDNTVPYFELLKIFESKRVLNNGGSIVALSSAAVQHCDKSLASYASSKAALEAASKVAAKELAKKGIRVNVIRPEMTSTPLTKYFQQNTTEDQKKLFYPLGMLTAEDVANAVVFLLSDMSSKLTGQIIYLSAGNDGRPIDYIV